MILDVVVPTRSLPAWSTDKRERPVEDEIKNGLVPAVPCTLKEKVDDVALIPATTPLSKNVDVANVVAPVKRAKNPFAPPVTPAPPVIPRDEVDTHWVLVPVDQRT